MQVNHRAIVGWTSLSCFVLATAVSTNAQNNGSWQKVFSALMAQDTANAHGHSSLGFDPAIMAIPGKPFTAKRIYTDQRQTDEIDKGDTVSAELTIARDSKGRVHYEMVVETARQGRLAIGAFDIQINDPVAHRWIRYFANADRSLPPQPVAEIRKLKLMSEISRPLPSTPVQQKPPDSAAPDTSVSDVPKPEDPKPSTIQLVPTKDNLPVQSINGINIVIHRMIEKYGPQHQFFQIQENWLSPEYALDMREVVLREDAGKQTVETRDIVEGEPDPSLFEIPSGYVPKYLP